MISLRRITAVAEVELRILARDPGPLLLLLAMPLAVVPFIRPGMRFALVADGYFDANGSEQAIPGLAVLFASLYVMFIGLSFYREHGWRTWSRLRTTSATDLEIVIGKTLLPFAIAIGQPLLLFALGHWIFDLDVKGSVFALAGVSIGFAAFIVGFGVFLLAFCSTIHQVNALANIGGIAFAGVGGTLAPVSLLPSWAQSVAPWTPHYWAMHGFQSVILDGAGLGGVVVPTLTLSVMAAGLLTLGMLRFRGSEQKKAWS